MPKCVLYYLLQDIAFIKIILITTILITDNQIILGPANSEVRGVRVGVSTPAIQSSGTRCAYKLGLLCKIYFNSCFSLADDKTGYPIVFVVRVIMSGTPRPGTPHNKN